MPQSGQPFRNLGSNPVPVHVAIRAQMAQKTAPLLRSCCTPHILYEGAKFIDRVAPADVLATHPQCPDQPRQAASRPFLTRNIWRRRVMIVRRQSPPRQRDDAPANSALSRLSAQSTAVSPLPSKNRS